MSWTENGLVFITDAIRQQVLSVLVADTHAFASYLRSCKLLCAVALSDTPSKIPTKSVTIIKAARYLI